jgi:pyridoxal phosphate enzyme (YggS family)
MLSIPQNLAAVRARLHGAASAAGRDPATVLLLAVSKGQPADRVREAAALGLASFGENYVAEALQKIQELAPLGLDWHFIGRLQANKTRPVAAHFDWVHGVDRPQIAQRLSAQRSPATPPLNICLQVNVLGEASKGGIAPADLPALLDAVKDLPRLRLRGLMCMLPHDATAALQHEGFARLRQLLEDAAARGIPLDTLSMGMSDDLEAAVAEGSTILRIGTALFGARAAAG